jgi:hypothetical protein
MTQRRDFETYTDLLREAAQRVSGVRSLVLLGSASEEARARRDEWSDHDFYAVLEPGAQDEVRRRLDLLPLREHVVLVAAEGTLGFTVLWDDGHLFEFGIGTLEELGAVGVDSAQVLHDPHGDGATLVHDARLRRAEAVPPRAEDAVGLALVKLLIGYGRARRGEVLSASAFVRGHAVPHLCAAVRLRRAAVVAATDQSDPFDPLRRFEHDHPAIASAVAEAMMLPVDEAARALVRLLRTELEPTWPEFPTAAADVVERRLATD